MDQIIDVAGNVGPHARKLADAGVHTVIRYYNHRNSSALPSKCLTRAEADALHAAGLSVAVVFQQRGGAGGSIADLDAASGRRDATRALELAQEVGQPEGSAIYFAVDHDFVRVTDLRSIAEHFYAARAVLNGHFRLGCYGSGSVQFRAQADLRWLPNASAWRGTKAALAAGQYDLRQLPQATSPLGFHYDGNEARVADFGQWPAPDAVSAAGGAPGPESEPTCAISNRDLQNRLNTLGALPRLAVDGVLGPLTWGALFHALKQHKHMSPAALSDEALAALGLIDATDPPPARRGGDTL